MASARDAQLLEQRRQALALRRFGGDRRRVLQPNSLAASAQTIGRRALEAEIQSYQKRYADGLISNEDMRNFLQKNANSELLSASEKVGVEDTLRNLDVKIRVAKLETAYKTSPENSPQRIEAAQALSNYYAQYAASLIPDTPAHQEYLQRSAQWASQAVDDQAGVEKNQRALLRAQKLYEVAQTPDGSLEELRTKVNVYQSLAQSARQDGNETEALQYETRAQNALDAIPALETKLNKKQITDFITGLQTDLNEGRITAQDYLSGLNSVSAKAEELNDPALSLKISKATETATKKVASERQETTTRDWDKQDFDYSDNIRIAQEMLNSGKWDVAKYSETLGKIITERNGQLNDRYQAVYQMASEDPNSRVKLGGKLIKSADALENIVSDRDDLSAQIDAVNTGNYGILEVPPDQFNQNGTIKKSGKSQATYRFIDTRNLPKDQYTQDESGVYHLVQRKPVEITYDEYSAESLSNPAAYSYDKGTGKYYKLGSPTVDVYMPGTSEKVVQPYVPEQKVATYSKQPLNIQSPDKIEQPGLTVQKPVEVQQKVEAAPSPAPQQMPEISPRPVDISKASSSGGLSPLPTLKPMSITVDKPVDINQSISSGGLSVKPPQQPAPAPQQPKNILQSGFDFLKSGIKNLSTKIFGR